MQAKEVEKTPVGKSNNVDQRWIQTEAINKGLSRALKSNKLEFVKLFLDYGADIEQVIGPFSHAIRAGVSSVLFGMHPFTAAARLEILLRVTCPAPRKESL